MVKVSPEKITIESLSNFISEEFKLKEDWNVLDVDFSGKKLGALLLQKNHIADIKCRNCDTTGTKNIKLTIREALSGKQLTKWLKVKLAVKVLAYTAKDYLPVDNQSLSSNDFKKETIETDSPEKFFKDKNFSYYKLNRKLKKGETLKRSHVHPINLVKTGEMAKVKLDLKGIKLELRAKPLSSGKLGDKVKLRNPKNHKIISGKVTDFNQVVVEL